MNYSIADIWGMLLSLFAFAIFIQIYNPLLDTLMPSLGPLEQLMLNLFPLAILGAIIFDPGER